MISNDLHQLGKKRKQKISPGFLLTIECRKKAIH